MKNKTKVRVFLFFLFSIIGGYFITTLINPKIYTIEGTLVFYDNSEIPFKLNDVRSYESHILVQGGCIVGCCKLNYCGVKYIKNFRKTLN
jgi:hypothetical protein